jgi:RNA polymerase sigma-70 factor (ECF subfamily)
VDRRNFHLDGVEGAGVSGEPRTGAPALAGPLLDEQSVVARAREGDPGAFAQLVDRYGGPVLSLCYASTANRADAEDLAQEVFLQAWRGLARFRGESAFSTWLFALARNRCVDRARRARARPRLVEAPAAVEPAWPLEASVRETARAVLAAAATLPLPLRQALLLRDVQGLAYEEIAALQDVPIGTVRSRIAAARSAVARMVGGS